MTAERNHFRVEYPEKVRPQFEAKKKSFPIINISESGILFEFKKDEGRATIGGKVKGQITFRDNETVQIEGVILRHKDDRIALKLSLGIPFQRIMSEQRWLISEFGTLKQPEVPK